MSTSSPGHAELRVEAADLLERLTAEGHVAPREVLGLAVGEQHVDRAAGRLGDAARDGAVVRRVGGWARPTPA